MTSAALALALAACGNHGTLSPAGTTDTGSVGGGSGGGGTGGGGGGGITLATATYTVSWSAVSDANVTGYKVYYSTTPLSLGVLGAAEVTSGAPTCGALTCSMDLGPADYGTGVPAGTTMYVGVTSIGSNAESPVSNQPSITLE